MILVILFISYYSGGFVAGRMARLNGVGQGLMVWLWAVIVAVMVAVLGMITRLNVPPPVSGFPRIPFNQGLVNINGIIAAAAALFNGRIDGDRRNPLTFL